jgi:hypothetical protein
MKARDHTQVYDNMGRDRRGVTFQGMPLLGQFYGMQKKLGRIRG